MMWSCGDMVNGTEYFLLYVLYNTILFFSKRSIYFLFPCEEFTLSRADESIKIVRSIIDFKLFTVGLEINQPPSELNNRDLFVNIQRAELFCSKFFLYDETFPVQTPSN